MKLTQILLRQHIGRHIKKHWRIQGHMVPQDSNAFKVLQEKNIPIYKPEDILGEAVSHEKVEVVGLAPEPVKLDQSHPNWQDRVCLTYKDNNVLLEGLCQAKSLTKTVEVQEGLPEKIIIKNSSKELDNRVKQIILNSHLFDAEQKKLPIVKDPARPAWNFPRTYGIAEQRAQTLLISKLLQLVESLSGPQLTKQRFVINDLNFSFPFEKSGNLIQLMLKGDTLVTSAKPLKAFSKATTDDIELPNLEPVKDTVTLNLENIYELKNTYPISKNIAKNHPHTVFIHYNATEVGNLYAEEVTESQRFGRSLMKTFTVAAAYAKDQFGDSVKLLPKPVTVQCVHTDGRLFHFGVLQLNTLDLESREGVKNIWYQTQHLPLYSSCTYNVGKPLLEGYNSDVIKHIIALYDNV